RSSRGDFPKCNGKRGGTRSRGSCRLDYTRLQPIRHPHRVAARLLVCSKQEQTALLAVGQKVIERPESVGPFVEARMPALDRLFDHRAPDGLTSTAFLGQGLQCF